MTQDADYRDLATLAGDCGLSVRTLRTRIHDPNDPLPAYRVGKKLLVRTAEFTQWMERRRQAARVDVIVAGVLRELGITATRGGKA